MTEFNDSVAALAEITTQRESREHAAGAEPQSSWIWRLIKRFALLVGAVLLLTSPLIAIVLLLYWGWRAKALLDATRRRLAILEGRVRLLESQANVIREDTSPDNAAEAKPADDQADNQADDQAGG